MGDGPAVVIDPGPDDEGHLAAVRDAAESRGDFDLDADARRGGGVDARDAGVEATALRTIGAIRPEYWSFTAVGS